MILWGALGALTALTLGLLLRPLLRPPAESAGTGPELAVYRDQLAELDRDLAAGRLPQAEAAAARREIERRVLALADRPDGGRKSESGGEPPKGGRRRPAQGLAVALLVLLPAAALGLYLGLGAPELPARPLAERAADLTDRQSIEAELASLSAALHAGSEDPNVWRRAGYLLVLLGETESAVQAFQTAMMLGRELGPAWESETWSLLADAIIRKNEGQVAPMARQSLARALELDPDNLLALFLSGLAMRQDGALEQAWELWLYVAETGGAELPWRARLMAAMEALGEALGRQPPPL